MRRSRRSTTAGQKRGRIVDAVSIDDRPEEVEGRKTLGSLEDHLEALVGAAATVGGSVAVTTLVHHLFRDAWPTELPSEDPDDNPIGRLQEWVAQVLRPAETKSLIPKKRIRRLPGYPDNAPRFAAVVVLPDGRVFEGEPAGNKPDAKRSAARCALAVVTQESRP